MSGSLLPKIFTSVSGTRVAGASAIRTSGFRTACGSDRQPSVAAAKNTMAKRERKWSCKAITLVQHAVEAVKVDCARRLQSEQSLTIEFLSVLLPSIQTASTNSAAEVLECR